MREQRRLFFEALVLQGIWLLYRAIRGKITHDAPLWRGDAISYLDLHGNQAPGAKEMRREKTFPECEGYTK